MKIKLFILIKELQNLNKRLYILYIINIKSFMLFTHKSYDILQKKYKLNYYK